MESTPITRPSDDSISRSSSTLSNNSSFWDKIFFRKPSIQNLVVNPLHHTDPISPPNSPDTFEATGSSNNDRLSIIQTELPSSKLSDFLINHVGDNILEIGLPLADIYAKITQFYSLASVGFYEATKSASLKFAHDIILQFQGNMKIAYTENECEDIDLGQGATTCLPQQKSEGCLIDIQDSFPIKENKGGINIANNQRAQTAYIYVIGEITRLLTSQILTQRQTHHVSRRISKGISRAFLEQATQQDLSLKKESLLANISVKTGFYAKILGKVAISAAGELYTLGYGGNNFNGLSDMRVVNEQDIPIQGNYTRTCNLENTELEPDQPPELHITLNATLTIPESRLENVNTLDLVSIAGLLGISAYILGTLCMRYGSENLIETISYNQCREYLASNPEPSIENIKDVKDQIHNALLEKNIAPPLVLKDSISEITTLLTKLVNKSDGNLTTKNRPEENHKSSLSHRLTRLAKGTFFISLKNLPNTINSLSTNLLRLAIILESSTNGIPYLSTGFNRTSTSLSSEIELKDQESRIFDLENEQGSLNNIDGDYNLKISFPASEIQKISADILIKYLLFIGVGLKLISSVTNQIVKNKKLKSSLNSFKSTWQNSQSTGANDGNQPSKEKEASRAMRKDGIISHSTLKGFTLFLDPLDKKLLNNTHLNSSKIGSLLDPIKDYAISRIYQTIGGIGVMGLALSIISKFSKNITENAEVRFLNNATVSTTYNAGVTFFNQSLFLLDSNSSNRTFISPDSYLSSNISLPNFPIPDPSLVTKTLSYAGLAAGAALIPLSILMVARYESYVANRDIQPAINDLPERKSTRVNDSV